MNKLLLLIPLSFLVFLETHAQTEFVLDPLQSMIMMGKGPGQDGTINPFYGQTCYAIVKNIGERPFSIRVQQKKEIIQALTIKKGESKNFKILKGYELYLDPNPDGIARASADYKKLLKETEG